MATDGEGACGQEALISSDSRRNGQEEKRLRVFGDAKLTRPDDFEGRPADGATQPNTPPAWREKKTQKMAAVAQFLGKRFQPSLAEVLVLSLGCRDKSSVFNEIIFFASARTDLEN